MISIYFLLFLLVELLDLVEDVFQSDGNSSLVDGELSDGLVDFVGGGLHFWGCKDW